MRPKAEVPLAGNFYMLKNLILRLDMYEPTVILMPCFLYNKQCAVDFKVKSRHYYRYFKKPTSSRNEHLSSNLRTMV